MRGGAFPETYGYLFATLIVGVAMAIVIFLLSRQSRTNLPLLVTLASALLVAEVLIAWVGSATSQGDSRMVSAGPMEASLDATPDIVLIVADAYIGLDGLGRYFGVYDPQLHAQLVNAGYSVPDLAFSPYPSTRAALASLLDMSYPIEEGPGINKATSLGLFESIGGGARIFQVLDHAGYTTTFLESGWSGSTCGPQIHHCVPSAFLDESTLLAIHATWLGPWLVDQVGYAFTVGATHTMTWLKNNAESLTTNGQADFVVAHLEIPHPPFHLEADCELNTSNDRRGVTMQKPGVDLDWRKAAYLAQAACFDSFLLDLDTMIARNSIVVVIGDHGSDIHHQLAQHPEDWTVDATRERLNVTYALREPVECPETDPVLLSNVLIGVLRCLGADELEVSPHRLFKYAGVDFEGEVSPVVEVDADVVDSLLSTPSQ